MPATSLPHHFTNSISLGRSNLFRTTDTQHDAHEAAASCHFAPIILTPATSDSLESYEAVETASPCSLQTAGVDRR